MNLKKLTLIKPINILVLAIILLFIYTVNMIYSLASYSDKLKSTYESKNLKGKEASLLINEFGNPNLITFHRDYIQQIDGSYAQTGEFYSIYHYYTGNVILDSIGYFPFGGALIYLDGNDKITGFDPYLE